MNEQVYNENIEATEMVPVETEEVYEEPKATGGNGLKILMGVCGLVAAAGAVAWHKTKDKREQKQIERLEKKGYVIYKDEPVEIEAEIVDETDANEVDSENEEI